MTVSVLLEQSCSKSGSPIKLATICQQLLPNLLQPLRTSSVNTSCDELVSNFVTALAFFRVETKNVISQTKVASIGSKSVIR